MTRFLMTDVIELLRAPRVITNYGESTYSLDDAVVVATGLGSVQLYFSTEYDIDRDTSSRTGRFITDDFTLMNANPTIHDWIRVNGSEVYQVDGPPMNWTLGGLHHHEVNIKHIEG